MKKIVVFTGSGVSAESGIRTFRDSGGLWEEYDISEIATPEAWQKNPELVQNFYNQRRKQVIEAAPNSAHMAISELESGYDVTVITQNIDDLHERAGSTKVIHLHGEIRKSRSTGDPSLIYEIKGSELSLTEKCEKGFPLRPHIVWFGEMVPMMEIAAVITAQADIFLVVGTSLVVYPAASLVNLVQGGSKKYYIDPDASDQFNTLDFNVIKEKAGVAVPELTQKWLTEL